MNGAAQNKAIKCNKKGQLRIDYGRMKGGKKYRFSRSLCNLSLRRRVFGLKAGDASSFGVR